jgi:hypothetical protein
MSGPTTACRSATWMVARLACAALGLGLGCGGGVPDARYPAREAGCPVKSLPGAPPVPVDDLGTVTADCDSAGGACERRLLDAVCRVGGDVAYGLGDNALTSVHPTARAAHTRRATQGPRERGCAVRVVADVAPGRVENIGQVTALCDGDDSDDTCLRELEDQVCLLGGDVVWQLDGPSPEGNKRRMIGRAAHSK